MAFKSLFHAALLATSTVATNLYVAETNGNLTTLSLTRTGDKISLELSSRTEDCNKNPSGLYLDAPNRILYCLDRASNKDVNGTLNSFSADATGSLSAIDSIPVPASGVWLQAFGGGDAGARGMAMCSYNKSAAAIVGISDDGQFDPNAYESWYPETVEPGPVTARQDASYLHHVIIDPTGKFMLMPDLGQDMIRVYTWDSEKLIPVAEQPSLQTEKGVGPRHGVFWTSDTGKQYLFFVGELDQQVHTYEITYSDSGLTWTFVSAVAGVDAALPAEKAPLSGIVLTPDNRFIIVSSRDVSFKASPKYQSGDTDTLSTFSIGADGQLTLVQLAPSGGWSPRQFSLNKKGDMIAVGHQNNDSVVIWQRDLESGEIIGEPTTIELLGAVVMTIWDETEGETKNYETPTPETDPTKADTETDPTKYQTDPKKSESETETDPKKSESETEPEKNSGTQKTEKTEKSKSESETDKSEKKTKSESETKSKEKVETQ
ncbi:uncharacterized protein L3040_006231 [Drepanopeziza brunnea f. sp. 'multigermtubi']|nr:hypothetical protein L3040_006231 [Drepanopeziza brunnea f. sp. 'multigermtubi']